MRFIEDNGQSAMLEPTLVPLCLLTSKLSTVPEQSHNSEDVTTRGRFLPLAESIIEFVKRFRLNLITKN